MCGIAGFFNLDQSVESYPQRLCSMLAMIEHRGPDSYGYYFGQDVGLANTRLSIIDREGGHQPMSSWCKRYYITFNGELFNYIELRERLRNVGCFFSSESDTEVVLQSLITWGKAAFTEFDGQFSLLFYDKQRHSIFAARDPIGERPLFYTKIGRGFAFASEIKALFALPEVKRSINPYNLNQIFELWTSLPEDTCFSDIHALAPGHILEITSQSFSKSSYYHLPIEFSPKAITKESEAIELLRDTLTSSVKRRLRSDVPLGIYLSGGLDSSIVAALSCQERINETHSFSVAFQDQEYDERSFQQIISSKLGTKHHELLISESAIAENFPAAIWHCEIPLFRAAPVPMYLLAQFARAQGVKVVLTGEGSDEFFFGYDLFRETLFRLQLNNLGTEQDQIGIIKNLYPNAKHMHGNSAASLLQFYSQFSTEKIFPLFSHEVRFSNATFSKKLLQQNYNSSAQESLARLILKSYPNIDNYSPLVKAGIIECITLLSGYLLSSQGDRVSSAHGLETRSPFLCPEVIALSFRISENLRLKNGKDEKYILKQAFKSIIPAEILNRRKQAYQSPSAYALLSSKAEYLRELTDKCSVNSIEYLDQNFVEKFVNHLRSKLSSHKISPREDMCLMFLVSLLVIERKFVKDFESRPMPSNSICKVAIDGT